MDMSWGGLDTGWVGKPPKMKKGIKQKERSREDADSDQGQSRATADEEEGGGQEAEGEEVVRGIGFKLMLRPLKQQKT